jgi:hypothetical protein
MNFSLYKPNSKVTGCAIQFKLHENQKKEKNLFVSAIQQATWDDEAKTGSFSQNAKVPEKTATIKLNVNEIGGLLNSIRNYGKEFSAFHSFEDNKTQISFKPYSKKDGVEAFSFSINKNGNQKFGIGIELSEAEALSEFLKFCLHQIYACRSNYKQE